MRLQTFIATHFLKNSVFLNRLYNLYYLRKNKEEYWRIVNRNAKLSIFDYELLAEEIPFYPLEFVKDSNFYGLMSSLREYTGLDMSDFSIEHGLYFDNDILEAEKCVTTKKIITLSKARLDVLTVLNKPTVAIGPYIHYAKQYMSSEEIYAIKKKYGKILLFFPSHSDAQDGNVRYNIERDIIQAKNFAKEHRFDSVFVSIFYYDVLHNDYVKYYRDAGFVLVSAGNRYDPYFISRLKSIITLSDFTISNNMGTHIGYCLWLNKQHYIINDHLLKKEHSYQSKEIGKFFLTYHPKPTEEQMGIVSEYWGFNCIKTKEELYDIFTTI